MTLEISTDDSRLDFDLIHRYLSEDSYWAAGIPRETLARALANSLNFGAYLDGRQIGFGRMITDRATFAYLADVFVVAEHRSEGVAKMLMESVMAHPDLQGLRRMLLATRDAQTLYARFGFTELGAPSRMMELHRPDVYQGTTKSR